MVALSNNPLGRLKRSIQRYGLIPSCKHFVSKTLNRIFRARLCVWMWQPGNPLAVGSDSVTIRRVVSAEELDRNDMDELTAGDGAGFTSRMSEEFSEGGVLWVGYIDHHVAGYQWSRRGNFVENWHFDLSERDVLIYSTVTFHEYRGRRVAAEIMARICREEVGADGRACADCMVWNTPAVRFIQRTGFSKVAERKPLPDHPD